MFKWFKKDAVSPAESQNHDLEEIQTLFEYINYPLNCEKDIIDKFKSMENSVHKKGDKPREEFVFIKGTREDRVTLVAHCDTVFDSFGEHELKIEDGKIMSAHKDYGIGGDDRAGCAMLWLLRDSGHNILVCNGEEPGHRDFGRKGSYFLIEDYPKIAKEIQESCFMLEFDRRNKADYVVYNIPVSLEFKQFIEKELGLRETPGGWTDIIALSSRKIAENCCCSANISVGYYSAHSSNEYLVIDEWYNAFLKYKSFLEKPQKRFINE